MTVRQNNREKWMVDIEFVHADGRAERIRKTSPVQTRRGAEAYERQIRQALLDGSYGKEKETDVPTLEKFQTEFIAWCRGERQKASGIESKESSLRAHLVPLFGDRRLDSFDAKDQVKLRKRFEAKSRSTYNNTATALNSLLQVAVELKVVQQVPFKFRLYKRQDKSRPFYDFDQFEWLVEAARKVSTTAEVIVLLGGEAGLRRSEMFPLLWSACDLRRRLVNVEEAEVVIRDERNRDDTKGRESRTVPMTQRLWDALKRHQHLQGDRVLYTGRGKEFTPKALKRLLMKVQRRARLEVNGNVHILRHTFCSHLAMRGAPAKSIQQLAGHRNLSTTLKYMHLAPGEAQRAIALLDDRAAHLASVSGNLTATERAGSTAQHQNS